MHYLVDFLTKERVEPKNYIYTGGRVPWEVIIDLEFVKTRLNADYFRKSPPSNSKYLPFMPLKNFGNFISIGEGSTPLIRSKKLGPELGVDLYFKLESQNPTGSFKDRGSAVELTIAKELGVKAIVVASLGNMAASCACYAAAAQIPCFVFVPEDAPPSKLTQTISYGGRIVQVKGNYNHAAKLAEEVAAELGFYLAGDYAYRVEGAKTAAFEIADQLFYQVPDAVFVPVGCGTNIAGFAKGFKEYNELGFIDRLPQIYAIQAEGAASVVNAFNKKSNTIEPLTKTNTICSGICVTDPLDGLKALDAVYSTGGQALAVSDREALEAQYLLSKEEGLFVEASSATPLASVIRNKDHFKGKKVILVLTGHGLKDPAPLQSVAIKPPTIYPEVSDFLRLFNNNFFEGKSLVFINRDTVVFSKTPSVTEVQTQIKHYFNRELNTEYIASCVEIIEKFLKKGKPITFSDFQDIIQEVLESSTRESDQSLHVEDFSVTTTKDNKPRASVVVNVAGKKYEATAQGVGPVDALISALKIALTEHIDFALANYHVQIRSSGTDAVVYVEMKLTRNGTVSVGKGTSPDIIQASIEAFETAYNDLASRA